MSNVPDYSQYIAVKKVRAVQTANSNSAVSKGRSTYRYNGYFPLYRNVGLPVNALLSNKFIQKALPPVIKYLLTVLTNTFDVMSSDAGEPTNAAFDGVDTIYSSCYFPTLTGIAIVSYKISTGVITQFASKLSGLTNSYGLAYDNVNSCLYHGNLGSNVIQKVVVSNGAAGTISTLNTSGTALSTPFQIAFDGVNTLYVANNGNHTIGSINVTTGVSTLFAGSPGAIGSTDGDVLTARFKSPTGLVYDSTTSSLYVADSQNFTIRKINLITNVVSTIAGTAGSSGFVEGIGSNARFGGIRDLSIDTTNKRLFATEEGNSIIRQIDLTTLNCIRIAGVVGQNGDYVSPDNDALLSVINLPRGSIYIAPYLYILDTRNNALKRIAFS